MQDFVNGNDFKEDMKRLVDYHSVLPEAVLKTGLNNFAACPPDDDSFITTRMWNKYLPRWRGMKEEPRRSRDPETDKKLIEELKRMSDAPDVPSGGEAVGMDSADYVALQRAVYRLASSKSKLSKFAAVRLWP